MIAYVLGAGASAHAGYPLASNLLSELSKWLLVQNCEQAWMSEYQNRIFQIQDAFGALNDFERILEKLDEYGLNRVKVGSGTSYRQCARDIWEDFARCLERGEVEKFENHGFYPQYLRGDLTSAVREFFRAIEERRSDRTAYERFSEQRVSPGDAVITLNYDVALERALKRAGKWDIGSGYGFDLFSGRPKSPVTVFKLHGSVNWFQSPIQREAPPLIFRSDLELLGYPDLMDSRVSEGTVAVNDSGTLILPHPNKHFYWENLWGPLWESAGRRLRNAREVFVHGYSLPQADTLARTLLFDNISTLASINLFCRRDSERIAAEFRHYGFKNVQSHSEVTFEAW